MNRNLFSVEKSFIATGALYCKARLVPSQLIFFNYSSLPHPPTPHKKKRKEKTWYRDSQLSDFKQRVRSKDFGAARLKDGRGNSLSPGPLKESRREKLTLIIWQHASVFIHKASFKCCSSDFTSEVLFYLIET